MRKLQATKSNGTVLSFYNEILENLKEKGYSKSVEVIKGKEKDFIAWTAKMAEYNWQSGNGCLSWKHYTIVTPASLDEEDVAKTVFENLHSAFNGTPNQRPELLDCGDDTSDYL